PARPPCLAAAAGVAFHAPEDRPHVLVAPAAVAELGPMIVVLALPAHPHHPVDGTRPSEHAPARNGDCASPGVVLGFGAIEPIHARPIDEARKAERHLRPPI